MHNFSQDLIEYCQSDVELLGQGVVHILTLIKSICSGIDPFKVACTTASACHYIYRHLFMLMKAIAFLPINGYRSHDATSFPA